MSKCLGCGRDGAEGRVDSNDKKFYCNLCWEAFADPLRQAWREERRKRPKKAVTICEELLSTGLKPHDAARANFLIGKVKARVRNRACNTPPPHTPPPPPFCSFNGPTHETRRNAGNTLLMLCCLPPFSASLFLLFPRPFFKPFSGRS